jgi:hypothetical protein
MEPILLVLVSVAAAVTLSAQASADFDWFDYARDQAAAPGGRGF